jgi:SAM-dependent methyltransferase
MQTSKKVAKLQKFIVNHVYGDHNKSARVKHSLARLLSNASGKTILNLGSGDSRLNPSIINLDIEDGPNVDIIGSADHVPLGDSSVDLVISQEMLEHVPSPSKVLGEVHRVLRPGGILYLQVPWVIGYHGCPNDYWRFSRDGIQAIVKESNFTVLEVGETVGPFTGFYRIAVEAFAIFGSTIIAQAYKPCKLIAAILFVPIKWLDVISWRSKEAHRLSGGFFLVASKDAVHQ